MREIMRKRRSIRKFTGQDVTQPQVREILNAAMFSPSAWNRRPWHFIVVRDRDTLKKLSTAQKWAKFVADAPVTIVVLGDKEASPLWIQDTSIVATQMLLAITNIGLGTCWTEVIGSERDDGGNPEDYVREILAVPEKYGILCMLPIGYPAEAPTPHGDEEFEESKVSHERFGR